MKSWVPRLLSSALVTAGILAVGIHVGYAAEAFPAKPIRIISPFSAGSPPDAFGRLIAQQLSVSLGQSVVIENRPGAGTTLGTKAGAMADPDGYTPRSVMRRSSIPMPDTIRAGVSFRSRSSPVGPMCLAHTPAFPPTRCRN